ncbi:hypothetical protein KKB40_03840 [Patescibacteria group bacterium]|nr:hypothetical protein [Patescibacteria group bacterium]
MKNKIPYFIIIILLVFIAFKYGESLISNIAPTQSEVEKTAETLDAWRAKWNNEVNNYCQTDVFSSVSP